MSIKILDVIKHRNKYAVQTFVVLNRRPDYKYERKGDWLIGEDSGFFSFYRYKVDRHAKAFAGREFDIRLKNGEVIKASGQWWDDVPESYVRGLIYHLGVGTPEELAKCNVFCASNIDQVMVNDWLKNNKASNNYHKYDKRHPDFGKHIINSKWD